MWQNLAGGENKPTTSVSFFFRLFDSNTIYFHLQCIIRKLVCQNLVLWLNYHAATWLTKNN